MRELNLNEIQQVKGGSPGLVRLAAAAVSAIAKSIKSSGEWAYNNGQFRSSNKI